MTDPFKNLDKAMKLDATNRIFLNRDELPNEYKAALQVLDDLRSHTSIKQDNAALVCITALEIELLTQKNSHITSMIRGCKAH